MLLVVCAACRPGAESDTNDEPNEEQSGAGLTFTPDPGIRIDFAGNAKIGYNADSSQGAAGFYLYHQAKEGGSNGEGGGLPGNLVAFSADGLTFDPAVALEAEAGHGCEGDQEATRYLAHPEQVATSDGLVRMYALTSLAGGVFSSFTSRALSDDSWFCDETGDVYAPSAADNGTMGVYHVYTAELAADRTVLLYLGDLSGTNNVRRALGDGTGRSFVFDAENVLGDAGDIPTVDISTRGTAPLGSRRLFGMRGGTELTSYVTEDDGQTWTGPEVILTASDFPPLADTEAVCSLFDPSVVEITDEGGEDRYRLYATAAIWDATAVSLTGAACSGWAACDFDQAAMGCMAREGLVSALSSVLP
jgi:hypothetical protein